ncbi:MAG TPA: hypothetical protein VHK01_14215 [Lacipirellulaceae bacterium]|jgi:hypothetical protein|nr:hypothetical protein [Lacipirellulaceae bacterium]
MNVVTERDSKSVTPALPSPRRLLIFAVLIPAVVAASNQLFFQLAAYQSPRRWWLYPWMVFTTAVLSWCAGRYLQPAWLRWLVFGWCLVLLDLLTTAACLSGPVPTDFAFVLISSQVSLLVIWSILADVGWQWRLPGLAAFSAVLVAFSGAFVSNVSSQSWGILMILTTIIVAVVCCGLRLRGFTLRPLDTGYIESDKRSTSHQFGTRHMLIWAAAMAPLLVVARGMEFLIFSDLNASTAFHSVLLALGIATLNLVAIWAVLGSGPWPVRLAALIAFPLALALVVERYTVSLRPGIGQSWEAFWFMLHNMEGNWDRWLWLNAALLAALLLFVRASGYRLLRAVQADRSEPSQ